MLLELEQTLVFLVSLIFKETLEGPVQDGEAAIQEESIHAYAP